MTQVERILERGAYTAPSGARFEFDFERVSSKVTTRRPVFEFVGVNGGYVQTNGRGGFTYPLRCIFSGVDSDQDALDFENGVLEDGIGRLEHPLYGTFDAVAIGDVERSDDLVGGINESIVRVSFYRPITDIYPAPQSDIEGTIETNRAASEDAAALEYTELAPLDTVAGQEGARVALSGNMASIESAMAGNVTPELRDALDVAVRSSGVLASDPDALVRSIFTAVNAAAVPTGAASQVGALFSLVTSVLNRESANPDSYLNNDNEIPSGLFVAASGSFHQARILALAGVNAAAALSSGFDYQSRPDAVMAAASVLGLWESVVSWSEAGFATLEQTDTGRAYQTTRTVVVQAAGFLIERSFDLAIERRFTLTRDRTILDLVAELYGDIDGQLDRFIDDNALPGSSILIVPSGTTVVYYA